MEGRGTMRERVGTVEETTPGALGAADGSNEARPVAHDDDPLDRANRALSRHYPS
jgi:hypothetical protein